MLDGVTVSNAGDAPEGGLAPGTEIGPYRVIGTIGRGGMGVVLEARHTRVGQRAALKLLSPDRRAAVDRTAVRRFLSEVDALSRLEHPGLVRILDCGESPAHGPWIAMEYVAGEVLRARVERTAGAGQVVPVATALRLTRRIASAVAGSHHAGIVHRDLKPDNVMVTPDDEVPGGERVKLLDFGIAKLVAADVRQTTEGTVLGTAGYMAPEQCTGAGDIDDRADVYAIGVIGFELLTGALPFVGAAHEVMRQHLFVDPPLDRLPAALPDRLRELIRLMLAKEPSRRPAIAEVVDRLRVLEASIAGAPEAEPSLAVRAALPTPALSPRSTIAVTRPGPGEVTIAASVGRDARPRTRRRWPWLAVAAVAAVLIGAAMAVGIAVTRTDSKRTAIVQPGMVLVPGASFQMGSTREELTAACAELPGGCTDEEQPQLDRELPAHLVKVSAFEIDVHEVTNREYAQFLNVVGSMIGVRDDRDDHYPRYVFEYSSGLDLLDLYEAGGIVRDPDKPPSEQFAARPGKAALPVIQVSWDGASRYCHHRGKRLPTEAEWELAARGAERRRFPWGAEPPRCDGVVFGRGIARGCPTLPAELAPVGTSRQDVTPAGVHDLAGNVGEWVQDQFVGPSYSDCGVCRDPAARDESITLADDFRMFRGGTFSGVAWFSRTTTRSRWKRTAVLDGVGFRCAHR